MSDSTPIPSDPIGPAPSSGITSGSPAVVGQQWPVIGQYHILSVLGHGGMGVVYLAEQREPVRRRVALKVIKPGMDSEQVVRRFEAERQALALMDHPGVAKVLDAGSTDRGLPFFVMENVPGEPITDFCDRHRLSIPDRLSLFADVCAAVQHAHHKGVIHRDLKPSNILVAFRDGAPAAKVIDFGIAKALSGHLAQGTIFTHQGQLMGTPEYMSPEQAEMSVLDIDTRSDVYSLGVILYELLTGALPFDSRSLRDAGIAAIQRIIREEEPPRPSTRLSGVTLGRPGAPAPTTPGDPADIAAHRKSDTRSLLSILRTDLDWVVLKCLEKDRARRYETPSALAQDLRRFLNNEPVSAGPPSALYRARKFMRRHRAGVTAGALVSATLLLSFACVAALWVRSMEERDIAQRERDNAERERKGADLARTAATRERDAARTAAAQAREASNFLEGLFSDTDPVISGPDDARRVRLAIDRAGARAQTLQPREPFVAAELRRLMGSMFMSIGDYAGAAREFERAVVEFVRLAGTDDPATVRAHALLAMAYDGQGRTAEAEGMLIKSLDDHRRILGPAHPDTLTLQNGLASHYTDAGRPDLAVPILRDALEKAHASADAPAYFRLMIKSNLAAAIFQSAMFGIGDPADGEALGREVADESLAILGPDNPRTITSRGDLAVMMARQGRLDEAISLLETLLPDAQRVFGPTHPQTIGFQMNTGTMIDKAGRHEDALPYFENALASLRATREPTHPIRITCAYNLSELYFVLGRLSEAEALAREVYDASLKARGPGDFLTYNVQLTLEKVCRAQGKTDEADMWKAIAVETKAKYGPPTAGAGGAERAGGESR
jgi:serine/threonine protein kinase/tetratricopeptide (TPR) repeat protein